MMLLMKVTKPLSECKHVSLRLRKQMSVTGDRYPRGGGDIFKLVAAASDKLHQSRTSHIII